MVKYRQQPVGLPELRSLVALARAEEIHFFARNPHLVAPYRNRLIAVALCQGAALQYIGCGYGVKDFDVHFFYRQNPRKPKLSRTVKRISADVGRFPDVAVDFIRTMVPLGQNPSRASEIIRTFLNVQPTANARHLMRKAVVGLLPDRLFAKVLWRASARSALAS